MPRGQDGEGMYCRCLSGDSMAFFHPLSVTCGASLLSACQYKSRPCGPPFVPLPLPAGCAILLKEIEESG